MPNAPDLDVFIGAPIAIESERIILDKLLRGFQQAHVPAVFLANFHLGGRQIDCVVATERNVWLIEAKSSALPVSGGLNGEWSRQLPTGQWSAGRNGYQQALDAKNRLRSAMAAHGKLGPFYPAAAVLFTDASCLSPDLTTGDFKVVVMKAAAFTPWAASGGQSPWTLAQWASFAFAQGLSRISPAEAVAPPLLADRMSCLREVRHAAAVDYAREGDRWIPESETVRDDMLETLMSTPGCLVTGPTGCGKSLIAKWFSAHRADAGECALIVRCKDYAGSWARLIDRELAMLVDGPSRRLYEALRLSDQPFYLILDGLNEVAGDRKVAIRGAAALCRRYGLRLIVTDQAEKEPMLAGLATLRVAPPSPALKKRIAIYGRHGLSANQAVLLDAIESGFEAAIIGEIGDTIGSAGRQMLVDQYIRRRLGDYARDGAAALRRFALHLQAGLSFSASETAFDELMLAQGVTAPASTAMFDAGLLVRRAGRVSFRHEMLLRASVAYALAAQAQAIGEPFAQLLTTPLLERFAGDVVSVVDDEATCRAILEASRDAALLHQCASGAFGELAQAMANSLIEAALGAVADEIAGLELIIVEGDRATLDWHADSLRGWSVEESARLGAVGHAIDDGERIETYLALCAQMDEHLLIERTRLSDACKAHGMRNPRTRGFWLAYLSFGQMCGFSILARNCHNSVRGRSSPIVIAFDVATATSGQLYFYLERRHDLVGDDGIDRFAEELIYIFKERYRFEPYHVQLAVMQAAGFPGRASAALIDQLVDAINATLNQPGPDTGGVDALKFLGALDEGAEMNRDSIEAEVGKVIEEPDDDEVREAALRITNAMFDHPFDHIYYDVVHALPEASHRLLLRRALGAPGARKTWDLGYLVREVALFADPTDMALMQYFAQLPDPNNVMPQAEWEGFVVATRFLGRLDLPLPPSTATSGPGECIEALRALVHAFESSASAMIEQIWERLCGMSSGLVIGCLSEMDAALNEGSWRRSGPDWPQLFLMTSFPDRCLTAARRFLDSNDAAEHLHRAWESERPAQYAFQCIETHGDRSDVPRLRRLTLDGRYTRMALRALAVRDGAGPDMP